MKDIRSKASLILKKSTRTFTLKTNRILFPILFRKPIPDYNIYHCCIQKTATQWFSKLLTDRLIWKNTGFSLYYPGQNFITGDKFILDQLKNIPKPGLICSPFYIQYNTFEEFTKNDNYKAFYIIRDPRDIIISNYYSLKYSHPALNNYIVENRKDLEQLSEHDGIMKVIVNTAQFISQIMHRWKTADNVNVKIYKFEDVFGPDQLVFLKDIFSHCRISLPDPDIQYLVDHYSFKNISGRRAGTEDQKHHYRKGVSGDWRNYFSEEHKQRFNLEAGEFLIALGYEQNLNW